MQIPKSTIERYLHSLMPSERSYLERLERHRVAWKPQSKTQWMALLTRADELFFGGAAGGGKTDLVLGMASECHHRSVIFRRVYPNLKAVILRAREIIGDGAQENKADRIWTWPDGRTLEFGAMQYETDKTQWQGRPHDLKAFDELPEFTKSQYQFVCGWNRTTTEGQRVRVIATGNPPIDEAGSWVIDYWGPWLNPDHPNPAAEGELRWYATVDGEEREFPSGEPVEVGNETIYPRSRTFIKSLVQDNPYLSRDSQYISVLQALPEPLRSMLLNGDFQASAQADPFQVIPSDWVRQGQQRWLEVERPDTPMTAVGIDPARGGRDNTSMARRYDAWFDEIIAWPGVVTKTGPMAAELIRLALGDSRPSYINVDVIGVGSSVYDSLIGLYDTVRPVNASEASSYRDRSGALKMRNVRAELYWRMRDALDPERGDEVALPPGNEILADLCSARYEVSTAGVLIEDKEQIKGRIGRSPDKGESLLLANYDGGLWWIH